ncbi:MAG: RNA polymerase sigma factor [candidate division Zixibacteria bacterium]|nr:RNA polymerase sigma factor [candidate division Zixibacteria bacterium]
MGEKYIDKTINALSDNELMEKLTGGDKSALTELMKRYQVKALNYAYRYLGDFDDCEDAAQDCFVKIYANRQRFDKGRPFAPWFYTILTNCCRDRLRHRSGFADLVERFTTHKSLNESETENSHSDTMELFNNALMKLPPAKREILTLRFTEDLSYQEIAETLGISQGTVMSRLFRARKELEKILKTMGIHR